MYLALFLFAVGVGLVVLELLIPSFGLLTITALVCFGLSVWRAHEASGPTAAWTMAIIAPILSIVILYAGIKIVPKTSWGRGLVLRQGQEEAEQEPTPSESTRLTYMGATSQETLADFVGKEGVAQSELRPVGIVQVEGRRVDCVTGGEMIEAGTRVKIVRVAGNRVVVRRVKV